MEEKKTPEIPNPMEFTEEMKEKFRKKLAEPENRAKIEEINRKLVNILKEAGVDITKEDNKKEDQ